MTSKAHCLVPSQRFIQRHLVCLPPNVFDWLTKMRAHHFSEMVKGCIITHLINYNPHKINCVYFDQDSPSYNYFKRSIKEFLFKIQRKLVFLWILEFV